MTLMTWLLCNSKTKHHMQLRQSKTIGVVLNNDRKSEWCKTLSEFGTGCPAPLSAVPGHWHVKISETHDAGKIKHSRC